jgi:Zn-finger nucleic acid-binding protein
MCTYERSGVEIDQCTECLGIYLDRGELPRLIDAEAAYFQPQQPLRARTADTFNGIARQRQSLVRPAGTRWPGCS